MKKLIVLTILTIALLLPTTSQAFDSAYSGAQVDAEIARGIGRNTTIANPGSDAELVTEQAVREALDALSLGTAATRDAEDSMTNGGNLPDGAAIKTYGDANWGGAGTLVFKTHDAPQGTDPVADLVEDTLQWLEGEGIDITGNSATDSITVKGEDASAANKGIASFNSTRFTVVAGAVDISTVAGITGANEDDVTLADIQGACTNDFHNIGGVDDERTQEEIDDYVNALIKDADSVHTRITITYDDPNNAFDFVVDDMNDDVPDAGDFGAAEDLNANGALNTGCVAGNEIASTAVVAGSYTSTNLTVDDDGRITAAANGSSSGDKIAEGNSNVEVIDTGTDGRIVFTTEGVEVARIENNGNFAIPGPTSGTDRTALSVGTNNPLELPDAEWAMLEIGIKRSVDTMACGGVRVQIINDVAVSDFPIGVQVRGNIATNIDSAYLHGFHTKLTLNTGADSSVVGFESENVNLFSTPAWPPNLAYGNKNVVGYIASVDPDSTQHNTLAYGIFTNAAGVKFRGGLYVAANTINDNAIWLRTQGTAAKNLRIDDFAASAGGEEVLFADSSGIIGNDSVLKKLSSGTIQLGASSSAGEGGELRLEGQGAYTDIGIDNYQSTFRILLGASLAQKLTLDTNGNLHVAGNITATGNCCVDYVFEDKYKLISLDQLQKFIEEENHLPNITIGQNDKVDLIGSVSQLLEKTEEQALYILQLHERVKALEARLN